MAFNWDAMTLFPVVEWYKENIEGNDEYVLVVAWLCFGIKVVWIKL